MKSIFGANVYHVPGLCLQGINSYLYISQKTMAQKPYFCKMLLQYFEKSTFKIKDPIETNILYWNWFLELRKNLTCTRLNVVTL